MALHTTSTIHYLRFELSPQAQQAVRSGRERTFIVIAHPNYNQRAEIQAALRAELAQDLA